jgi:hypothetical protein
MYLWIGALAAIVLALLAWKFYGKTPQHEGNADFSTTESYGGGGGSGF